jgi:hypothetical protein
MLAVSESTASGPGMMILAGPGESRLPAVSTTVYAESTAVDEHSSLRVTAAY